MSINSVGSYGYFPQASAYNVQTPNPYQGQIEFTGIVDNDSDKKAKKGAEILFNTLVLGAVAGLAWLVSKGKAKGLLTKLKDFIKETKSASGAKVSTSVTTAAETAVETAAKKVKPQKVKVKTQKSIIAEAANLTPRKKVKITDAGGKKAARKVRRNEKKIIQQALEQVEKERFTTQELMEYSNSLHTHATQAERTWMAANNKPATESMTAVAEHNGLKVVDGQLVKNAAPVAAKPVQKVNVDVSKLLEEKTKLEGFIAKYSKSGMERWAEYYTTRLQQLEKQLAGIQA